MSEQAQIWNAEHLLDANVALAHQALRLRVQDVLGTNSFLLELQIGGESLLRVQSDGTIIIAPNFVERLRETVEKMRSCNAHANAD